MALKDYIERFLDWFNTDPLDKEENEDFERFVKRASFRSNIIIKHFKKIEGDPINTALMIESAYSQKKIADANKTLGAATVILAIATTALVIATAYGKTGLEKSISEVSKVLAAFLLIALFVWGLTIIARMLKFIFKNSKK